MKTWYEHYAIAEKLSADAEYMRERNFSLEMWEQTMRCAEFHAQMAGLRVDAEELRDIRRAEEQRLVKLRGLERAGKAAG